MNWWLSHAHRTEDLISWPPYSGGLRAVVALVPLLCTPIWPVSHQWYHWALLMLSHNKEIWEISYRDTRFIHTCAPGICIQMLKMFSGRLFWQSRKKICQLWMQSTYLAPASTYAHLEITAPIKYMKIKPELFHQPHAFINYLSTWQVISEEGWILAWICKCSSLSKVVHSYIVHGRSDPCMFSTNKSAGFLCRKRPLIKDWTQVCFLLKEIKLLNTVKHC